jgi:hypothetical protein
MNNIILVSLLAIIVVTLLSIMWAPVLKNKNVLDFQPKYSEDTRYSVYGDELVTAEKEAELDRRIRSLSEKIDDLDKRTNVDPITNYKTEGRDFDQTQFRLKDTYGLFRQCPRHWNYVGDVFLPYFTADLDKLPFDRWKRYNNQWTWTRPRLCKSDSDFAQFDNVHVLSDRCDNVRNDKGQVMMVYSNDDLTKSPFRIPRVRQNNKDSGWINTYPRVCYVRDQDEDLRYGKAYVLASKCPNMNKDVGSVGILLDSTKEYPFQRGSMYDEQWQWYFPRLCKAIKS